MTGYRTITIKMEFGIWSSSTISDRCMCVWCLKRLCKCFVYRKSSSIFWSFYIEYFIRFFFSMFSILSILMLRDGQTTSQKNCLWILIKLLNAFVFFVDLGAAKFDQNRNLSKFSAISIKPRIGLNIYDRNTKKREENKATTLSFFLPKSNLVRLKMRRDQQRKKNVHIRVLADNEARYRGSRTKQIWERLEHSCVASLLFFYFF